MRLHYQNLDDGVVKRFWTHGRAWLRPFRVEWTVPMSHCGWSVSFGGGDGGRDFGVTFALPWITTAYVTIEDVFPLYPFGTDFDRGTSRQIGCYFHDWTFRYSIWVGEMASWSRSYPWCKWWRQGSIDFRNLLGRQSHHLEILKEGIPITIPMPEGVYQAVAKIERRTWKRPLWFATRRVYTAVDIPKGIPFAGKGENSWDCGDDGLFGYAVDGTSLDKAIARGVESVLESRRRNGMPSDAAIREALSQ